MTNREKAIVIINVLNNRTMGKESDVIKTEILCAAKEAFDLGISYFEFASIAADAWFEGNKRVEVLSKKVREVVESIEDNMKRKQYKNVANGTSVNNHLQGIQNNLRFQEEAIMNHMRMVNGF